MLVAADVDWVARTIAGGSLAFAALATAVGVAAFRRDRPNLRVGWGVGSSYPQLEVTLTNVGREPLAIKTIGISAALQAFWIMRLRSWDAGRWLLRRAGYPLDHLFDLMGADSAVPLPVVLQPGEPHMVAFSLFMVLRLSERAKSLTLITFDTTGSIVQTTRIPSDLIRILEETVAR